MLGTEVTFHKVSGIELGVLSDNRGSKPSYCNRKITITTTESVTDYDTGKESTITQRHVINLFGDDPDDLSVTV